MEDIYKKYLFYKEKYSNEFLENYPVLYEEIENSLTYIDGFGEKFNVKRGLHVGRAKLFDSEFQFINNNINYNEKAIIFYAGSAPAQQLYLLGKLYPNIKFVYIDPAPFTVVTSWRKNKFTTEPIYHYNDFFNENFVYLRVNKKNKNNIYIYDLNEEKVFYGLKDNNKEIIESNPYKIIDFIKNTNYQFICIEDFFIDSMCSWMNKNYYNVKTFFFSDIRTVMGTALDTETEGPNIPNNSDIIINNAQQFIWLNHSNCDAYMFKFHPPYPVNEIQKNKDIEYLVNSNILKIIKDSVNLDFLNNYINDKYEYVDGLSFIQSWAAKSTTEVRLVIKGIIDPDYTIENCLDNISNNFLENKYKLKYYDNIEIENKFMFYNRIDRTETKYKNKLIYLLKDNYVNNSVGYDYCPDCAREIDIISDYVKNPNKLYIIKFKDTYTLFNIEGEYNTIEELGYIINCVLHRSLKIQDHGFK